ncbi:39S ribosomal protein L41, mitochondrial-like [Haliotis rufescens]|uniref:39S ribosomal protein L41, mitochondrial-like n=1 Tax=Haliotis rufescens TaxID=6454 RepID=UPI00201F809A|nr:39S ribosomal protein L41, mitochondrial-like [Haliotis rufescens]
MNVCESSVRSVVLAHSRRYFGSSSCRQGKKTRVPFDRRFPVTAKHVNRHVKGGSVEMEEVVAKHVVPPTGFQDPQIGRYRNVPEMIPEFVVPDLTDFKLKPYVSYKVSNITQTKFTAKDLFHSCYANDIVDKFSKGEITVESSTQSDSKHDKS